MKTFGVKVPVPACCALVKEFDIRQTKPHLSDEQKDNLKEILQNDPNVYGKTAWTGKAVQSVVSEEFGISISESTGRVLMKECDSSIKPAGFGPKSKLSTEQKEELNPDYSRTLINSRSLTREKDYDYYHDFLDDLMQYFHEL